MGGQQPTPQLQGILLRTASSVLVLLAAHTGSAWPVCAAFLPPGFGEAAPAASEPDARAAPGPLEGMIRSRAARASVETRASVDAMLDANVKRVDRAAARARSRVAGRLGAEFGSTAKALSMERSRLGVSWGELVVVRTLAANTQPRLSPEQLVALHRDDVGWGLLAAGLGLDLADVVSAVNAEARVATGAQRPDGKCAPIRNDGGRSAPDDGPRVISARTSSMEPADRC